MIRPKVAGQFYEDDFDKLNRQIEECFHSERGPGDLPTKRKAKRIFGTIVPHAGYQFSGPCQAWAYKELAESKFPSTFIILAPDHSGIHRSVVTSKEDWQTPFGLIKVNEEFIEKILKKCKFVKEGKIEEHAIEVQLPFLQYINKDKLKEVTFVPLIIPSSENYMELGEAIAEIDENVCVIASSDFTHFGPQYDYVPFTSEIKDKMYSMDKQLISYIKKLDSKGFLEYRDKVSATVCGVNAIAVALEIIKNLYAKKGELLMYYTSGDILENYNNAVGYAAIVFE